MKRAFCTFALLVAKWLCQNSVSFSRSGWRVFNMRSSHHALRRACGAPGGMLRSLAMKSDVRAKSSDSGAPASTRASVLAWPSLTPAASSAAVAPNPARRYRCPTFFRSHGFAADGVYGCHAVLRSSIGVSIRRRVF